MIITLPETDTSPPEKRPLAKHNVIFHSKASIFRGGKVAVSFHLPGCWSSFHGPKFTPGGLWDPNVLSNKLWVTTSETEPMETKRGPGMDALNHVPKKKVWKSKVMMLGRLYPFLFVVFSSNFSRALAVKLQGSKTHISTWILSVVDVF